MVAVVVLPTGLTHQTDGLSAGTVKLTSSTALTAPPRWNIVPRTGKCFLRR